MTRIKTPQGIACRSLPPVYTIIVDVVTADPPGVLSVLSGASCVLSGGVGCTSMLPSPVLGDPVAETMLWVEFCVRMFDVCMGPSDN